MSAVGGARDNIDVVGGQLLPQVSIIGDLNRPIATTGPASAANLAPTAAATPATMTATITAEGYRALGRPQA